MKSAPEVRGAESDAVFGSDIVGVAAGFDVAVGGSELDADAKENGVGVRVVVRGSLLRAVTAGVCARMFNDLSVGSEELDFRNARTFLRGGKRMNIRLQGRGGFVVVALAEEIGFADGLVGKRKLERECLGGQEKRQEKRDAETERGMVPSH